MTETASTFLGPWSTFYAMIGSSAAALTGLMFIVVTLAAGTERLRDNQDGVATFNTPTVMHFGAALLIAAILLAPWHALIHVAVLLGIIGLYGIVYVLRVTLRTRGLNAYTADAEDWVWYSLLPFIAYSALLAGAIALRVIPPEALAGVAGGAVLLIFIGIRNAWDVVTYIATRGPED